MRRKLAGTRNLRRGGRYRTKSFGNVRDNESNGVILFFSLFQGFDSPGVGMIFPDRNGTETTAAESETATLFAYTPPTPRSTLLLPLSPPPCLLERLDFKARKLFKV